jgi:hypothetical protein
MMATGYRWAGDDKARKGRPLPAAFELFSTEGTLKSAIAAPGGKVLCSETR